MKKAILTGLSALFLILLLAGCATYRVNFESAREWIEGKPYPVQITIKKTDKLGDVVVHYSFNGSGQKTIDLQQTGTSFSYTIPGEEVVAGTLRYTIAYTVKGKAKSSDTISVRILTLKEASEKYTQQLNSRISFSPPGQVPINREARLTVTVGSAASSTAVTFFYKSSDQDSFQEESLRGENGSFTAVLSSSDLEAGIDTYYFDVTEENDDVGTLQVFVDGRDADNPFTFDILSLDELREIIESEIAAELSHTSPVDVYPTRDLTLSLDFSYPPKGYTAEYTENALTVDLFYKGGNTNYKQGIMSAGEGQFTYTIPSADLEAGYNSYYFNVSDEMEDIGTVSVDFPAGEELFSYNILTIAEIQAMKKQALTRELSHTPVTEVTGISDVDLTIQTGKGVNNPSGILNFREPGGKGYKRATMTRSGSALTGVITAAQLQKGIREYYFTVTVPDQDLGSVTVELPAQGAGNPYTFTMMDRNVVKGMLESELQGRISHRPVTTAAEGENLSLTVDIKNPVSGTTVDFFQRKPGDSGYRRTRIDGSGSKYTMVMPKKDIREGYSQYYFRVREPNPYFDYLTASLGTAAAPYEFEISRLKDAVLNGIDFTPLSDVEYGEPVEAKVILNNNPEGTRVFFRYRLADDTVDYLTVEMNQSGNSYTTALSQALLKESGRIDYYLLIELTGDEFTYPDENILPLYFSVKEQLVEEDTGDETVFGTTGRSEENMLEGRIFQLEEGTKTLPQNMHRDYQSLIILYTRKLNIPARSFTEGFPGLEDIFEWFGVQYRGLITVQESGLYKFRLHSDDGSKLYVDSILVIDNDGTHAPRSKTGEIFLSPGTYPIRIDYFQGPRQQIALQMFAAKPGEEEKLFDLSDFE